MARILPEEAGDGNAAAGKNVCAFLDMLAFFVYTTHLLGEVVRERRFLTF